MIISLGSSPKVIESINRKYKINRETYFFDSILCNFETVLHFYHVAFVIIVSSLLARKLASITSPSKPSLQSRHF